MIIAAFSTKDVRHAEGEAWLDRLAEGRLGRSFTTDFVVAESLNYFVAKARDRSLPDRVARSLLGEDDARWIHMLRLDEATWQIARDRFRMYARAGLSFTDCTSVAAIEQLGLDGIVSFDSGFDGIVKRHA